MMGADPFPSGRKAMSLCLAVTAMLTLCTGCRPGPAPSPSPILNTLSSEPVLEGILEAAIPDAENLIGAVAGGGGSGSSSGVLQPDSVRGAWSYTYQGLFEAGELDFMAAVARIAAAIDLRINKSGGAIHGRGDGGGTHTGTVTRRYHIGRNSGGIVVWLVPIRHPIFSYVVFIHVNETFVGT